MPPPLDTWACALAAVGWSQTGGRPMRSSWPARLLPTVTCLAEGAWLAVVYAAIQVVTGHPPEIGPLELALLAGVGMAWARRNGWRSRVPEAIGLPILAVLGGALGWVLDPTVRHLLVE